MSWYRISGSYACVPPKNGSTSFKRAVCGGTSTAQLDRWAANYSAGPFETPPDDGRPAYLAVREPVARFCSLWRSCQRTDYHPSSFVVTNDLQGCSPDALMDCIEQERNEHWSRQSDYMVSHARPVPFDCLYAVLGLDHYHLNRTAGTVPPLPIDRITAYYAADVDLWEQASR